MRSADIRVVNYLGHPMVESSKGLEQSMDYALDKLEQALELIENLECGNATNRRPAVRVPLSIKRRANSIHDRLLEEMYSKQLGTYTC